MESTRRDFLKATTVASGFIMTGCPVLAATEEKPKQSKRIGVALQLYSVRGDCAKDFDKTLEQVAAMGVTGVEFAGFHKYGDDAKGLKKQLDANGLSAVASFIGVSDLQGDALKRNIEFARTIDCKTLTVGGDRRFCSIDGNKQLADIFNKAAAALKPEGVFCGYHNHAKEMGIVEADKTWWDLFAERTSNDVILHLDVSWVAHGGQDPVELIRKYPGRTRRMHAKPYVDHNSKGHRDFIGYDSIDWNSVITACHEVGGTEWFTVEQETYPEGKSPMQCSDISIKGLKLKLADTQYGKSYYV